MDRRYLVAAAALLAASLAGCKAASGPQQSQADPVASDGPAAPATIDDSTDAETFDGIAASETVRFTGTEPFWGGEVAGSELTYSTPDAPDGTAIKVTRFAGRGGLSWTGTYQGAQFTLAVTPGQCSDGMSDRTYPFVATLEVAGEQRSGCAWTDRQSFTGPANP